jgi:hypothetical protein
MKSVTRNTQLLFIQYQLTTNTLKFTVTIPNDSIQLEVPHASDLPTDWEP